MSRLTPFCWVFILNECYSLSNAISTTFKMTIWFLSFFDVIHKVDRFANTEPSLRPGNKSHLTVVNDLFNVSLYPASLYVVEDFCIYNHQGYWPFPGILLILVLFGSFSEFFSYSSFWNIFLPPHFAWLFVSFLWIRRNGYSENWRRGLWIRQNGYS